VVSTVTPTFPQTVIETPNFATDSSASVAPPERGFYVSAGDVTPSLSPNDGLALTKEST